MANPGHILNNCAFGAALHNGDSFAMEQDRLEEIFVVASWEERLRRTAGADADRH